MSKTVRLKTRYYRALPTDRPGFEDQVFSLPLEQVALVGMHCWNIGCPDGPPVDYNYCVGMGWPQAAAEAWRIMQEVIRPAMDLCREAGVRVCHVESDWMDHQYPQLPSRRDRSTSWKPTGRQQEMLDRAHGTEYLARSPLAHMKRAALVSPVGGEPQFFYTDQLHEYLQQHGIDTLIYTGFAADMCLLGAEGGAQPMLGLGYRCILIREATVGVERPDTFDERLATRYGIHRFEWQVGYSTAFADFAAGLAAAN
jgi:nicotinamidase-related amidase